MFRSPSSKIVAFAVLALLTLALLPVSAQEATDVATSPNVSDEQTLFLTFVPNIQFAPFYVAAERGYFAEQGLTVRFEHGDEPVGVDLIAAAGATGGRQFGVISGEQVIAARANGRPVVSVYEWFQQYPVGIAVTTESGYDSVEALRGQRVGIAGRFGASYSGLIALLAANGMAEADIVLEEIGFNAPEVICVGGIDAAVVYINNEPLQVEERVAAGDCDGADGVQVFPVSAQADLVANGLITNEATIAENPELVRRMVAAVDRGLADAIRNPAQAYLDSVPYVETLPLPPAFEQELIGMAALLNNEEGLAMIELESNGALYSDGERRAQVRDLLDRMFGDDPDTAPALLQFDVLLSSIPLWEADRLGYSDAASWETTQAALLAAGVISETTDTNAAFSNDFLPPQTEADS